MTEEKKQKFDLESFFQILIIIVVCLTWIFVGFKLKSKKEQIQESQAYKKEIDITPYDTITDLRGTIWSYTTNNLKTISTYTGKENSYAFYFTTSQNRILFSGTLNNFDYGLYISRIITTNAYVDNDQNTNFMILNLYYFNNNTNNYDNYPFGLGNKNTADFGYTTYSYISNSTLYFKFQESMDVLYDNSDLISFMENNFDLVSSPTPTLTQLATPTITKSNYNQISWTTIQNAEYYEIYKDNELIDTTINTLYTVNSLGSYQVLAVGDGVTYSNSELSNTILITSSQLVTPTITINNDLISWLNIQNATSYEIYLDNELIDTIYNNSYTITQNGNYQVKAISNNVFFINSNLSNILYVNYQYAKVTFYAKDNITELISIENWLIGKSIYNFTNVNYNYNSLITLLLADSGYTQNDITYGYIDFIFNDNQLFENSYFGNNFIISSDINIYYKTTTPLYPRFFYDSNDYTLTSSNSSDLFTNLGDNLISQISLNTINVKYNYLTSQQTSIITTNTLLSDFVIGDNFSIYVDSYGNNFYFDCLVTQNGSNYVYTNYLYRADINSNTYIIPVMDYNKFVLYNVSLNKYEFIQNLSNVSITIYNTNFATSFLYNQGINFYYCNYIGFTFNIENYNTNNATNNFKCYIQDTNNMFYQINYNYGSTNLINNFNYILLNSNYFNSYIYKNTYLNFNFQSLLVVNGLSTTYDNKADCITALENLSIKFSFGNPILYYYDTTDKTNSATGTGIIPTSSDGLYKTDFAWYDVTAYLYNFLIYFIFDMPIVSNITKLIYQIIELILFVINQIILLFSGVTNNIFLVAILGFLLLKFVINLLVKH